MRPPPGWVEEYATHRPSGENVALSDALDSSRPNGTVFLPSGVKTHNACVAPFTTENSSVVPSRDHDSGTCSSSAAAVVRRSAVLEPSATCQKIPRSPSRADWKVTRRLSPDHTGKRLLPSNVRRFISVVPDKS